MKRSLIVAAAAALALLLAACGSTGAADSDGFPEKDIKMVVTYAAGGPTDLGGRAVAKYFEEKFDVNVVVENVEGASGGVGTGRVAHAKPDGYTIGMTTASATSRVPLIENVGFSVDDLAPIGAVSVGPGMIYVPTDSPYKTGEELFAAAKAKPNTITVGTAGAQSPQHVELQRLEDEYGISFRLVPFEGESPAMTGLVGDNLDAVFGSNAAVSLAQVESGKARVVAVGSEERLDYAPDAATLTELGYDGMTFGNSTFILVAPADVPDDVLAELEAGLQEALEQPDVVKVIGEERVAPEFIGSDDLAAQMEAETTELKPVLEKLFG